MPNRNQIIPWLILAILSLLLLFSGWCGYQISTQANKRAVLQHDYSVANSIVYGLFSADRWKQELKEIVADQIRDFELTSQQERLVREQVSSMMNALITKAKKQINENDTSFKKKFRKWGVNAVIDWEEIRKDVPEYSQTVIDNLQERKSKERIKQVVQGKIEELAEQTYDQSDSMMLHNIYQKYNADNREAFNETVLAKTDALKTRNYRYGYTILAVLVVFLLAWLPAIRYPNVRKPLFILSVLFGAVLLIPSLASPMIEIDARIQQFDFVLMGQDIAFHDQILYFRSKSILEVVSILVQSAKVDSIIVGILVLAFSVILPVSKLSANGAYLLSNSHSWLRQNKIVQWLAFKSGKWSMADVMVVAIFMAFVGFDGIIDNQLQEVEFDGQMLTSIATNNTSLLVAFNLFLGFVLYNLILSEILGRITKKKEVQEER